MSKLTGYIANGVVIHATISAGSSLIDEIRVNGVVLVPVDKMVDVSVPIIEMYTQAEWPTVVRQAGITYGVYNTSTTLITWYYGVLGD